MKLQPDTSSIRETTSDYDRKTAGASCELAGGVAVILLVERQKLKLKSADPVGTRAYIRAAVQEGTVAGGGVALVKALSSLDKLKAANGDQEVGIRIIRKALESARQIANNAGADGS